MDFQYSTIVDKSAYDPYNLCEGIDLRKSDASDLEEVGAFRAQAEWNRWVAPVVKPYKGILGPNFGLISVAMPECIPERLEVLGYALEFATLHDDLIDENVNEATFDDVADTMENTAQTGDVEERRSSGKSRIAAQIVREMMAIDRERAVVTAKSWADTIQSSYKSQTKMDHKTLDEYIPYRWQNAGFTIWHGLITFGCAIKIPEEETDLAMELIKPGSIGAALTNDLYSYEKERNETNAQNAILVVMKERNCSEESAKDIVVKRVKAENAKFFQTVKTIRTRTDISDEVKRYVELMQYTITGNICWSAQLPRYHPEINFNELQLLRTEHGIDKYPTTWQPTATTEPCAVETEQKETLTNGDNFGPPVEAMSNIHFADDVNGHSVKPVVSARTNGHKRGVSSKTNGFKVPRKPTHIPRPSTDSLFLADAVSMAVKEDLPDLSDDVVLQPYRYLTTLPSKGFRDQAIDSLNTWLKLPQHSIALIKNLIKTLHSASLMLDDMEDGSPLRRGRPSTHEIFGNSQTINSATYQYTLATAMAAQCSSPAALRIFIEETQELYIGQSYDLYWTHNALCPSMSEYLKMIDKKTGGLFRMLTRLMIVESPIAERLSDSDLNLLSCLIGRFFQIRDDYQNLVSADYAKQKGFAEDLDEGKYSYTLIHCIQALDSAPQLAGDAMQLRSILMKRRFEGKLSNEAKREVLEVMKRTRSLEYTLRVLRGLHGELEAEVEYLERKFGQENFSLRLMLEMLKV